MLGVATGTNSPGIAYSSIGLPGATAWTAEKWTPAFAANDLQKLKPDLILIEYGTREGFDDTLDAKQYEMRFGAIIDQIREKAPQSLDFDRRTAGRGAASNFAGGAGAQACRALDLQETAIYDRMTERADERLARWHSPPKLDAVRAAQRRAAANAGVFYWDRAKSMGGACSIHAWASATPPLAEPDHITLTEAGDGRSARALFAELMARYDAYQRALLAKAQAIASAVKTKPASPPRRRKSIRSNRLASAMRNRGKTPGSVYSICVRKQPQRRSRAGACEKSANLLKSGPQRRPREGGDRKRGKSPGRHPPTACQCTSVMPAQAGIHGSKKHWSCMGLAWVPAFAGTTPRFRCRRRMYDRAEPSPGLLPLLQGTHIRACSCLLNGFPPSRE